MKHPIPVIISLLLASLASAMHAQNLPEGKGKDVVENICGSCHLADNIAGHRATKESWGYIVDDMISRGASASNEQIKTINEYLAKNFGQVNTNKAPSAEIASVLEITSDQADAIVKYRTNHGDFKTLDDVKKVPGLAGADVDKKKDRIVFN